MVVSPHPDDAEINAGGTITSWCKQGREVFYVICTNGDKGNSDPNMTSETLAQMRPQEQMEAVKILGVSTVIFLGYPDGGLEDTPVFRGELWRLIRERRPEVVLATDSYRKCLWHRDHRMTGIVTMNAIFPYVRDHLSYPEQIVEGLKPHKLKEIYFWVSEESDTSIDVEETFSLKLAALSCHVSQVAQYDDILKQHVEERASKAGQGQVFL